MSAKFKPKASKDETTQKSALFILHYKTRRLLVGSPKDYAQLQLSVRRHFPDIPADHRVSYHKDELPNSKGAPVEISEDIWDTAIPLLSALTVQTEPQPSASRSSGKRTIGAKNRECDSSCDESDDPKPPAEKLRQDGCLASLPPRAPPHSQGKHTNLTLNIVTITGQKFKLRYKDVTYRAVYEGQVIGSGDSWDFWDRDPQTIQKFEIKDGDEILILPHLTGGKPVIYLFPPTGAEIDASVKLSLVPEWHFSAIYPVTLRWDVKASSDGTLLEKYTGLDVAYLFWEAETFAFPEKALFSPSSQIYHDGESVEAKFIPTQARVEPSNSVVLEVATLTPYLDSILKALGLHVEARTSFITYWLPSFLKHTHVALRFLPQQAYEHAAPLEVEPKLDLTVRVFMLFKGLKQDEVRNGANGWCEANEGDENKWKRVVGVNKSHSLADRTLFIVVEWGGMEVLS